MEQWLSDLRLGFRSLARADPDRWVVVDGGGTVAEVAERVLAVASSRLGLGDPPT